MRRLLMVLALVLVPGWAAAQTCYLCYHPPASGGSGTWDGGAFTDPAEGPTACTNPAYSFTGDTASGLCRAGAANPRVQSAASGARALVDLSATNANLIFIDGTGNNTEIDIADDEIVFALGGGQFGVLTPSVVTWGRSAAHDQIRIAPVALGAGSFVGSITSADLTAARTWTLPDVDWTARCLSAGTGVAIANACGIAGNPSIGVDTAVVNTYASGTGDVPATGAVGTFYAETDTNSFYTYPSTNTEHWLLSIAAGTAQGDLFYASAADVLSALAKDTNATRYLSNTGASNNPAWAQVALATGVSGDLPLSNLAQASGASVLLGRGSAGGAGDFQEITLGTNLSMSGTTLNASGSSSFNPATTVELYEEFLGGELSADRIGTHGLRHVALSSANPAYVASTTVHPGLFRLESSASDNSTAIIATSGGGSSFYNVFDSSLLNTYDWQFDVLILMGSNSTALTSSAIWMGWTTSLTGTPDGQGNGIWIRRDTDLSDSSFMFQVCDGAGGTGCASADDNTNTDVIASTITPSAGTYYRLRMRFDPTGVGGNPTLYMRVNDETELTFCSSGCDDTIDDMPGSGVGLGYFFVGYAARAGSAVRSGDVDYLYIKVENIARY